MDNLTHTLFGLTIANAGFRRAGRGTTAALVVASSIPDIEFLAGIAAGRVAYLSAHRGPTHGPLGIGLGLLVAGGVFLACRWRDRRSPGRKPQAASFAALALAGVVGVLGHIALDLATSYGTRVLSPFNRTWYGVDWLPIVDPYLLLILAGGLAAAWARPARRGAIAIAALLAMTGYYGARASAHDAALEIALDVERSSGIEDGAPGQAFFAYLNSDRPAALPAALPTRSSPFRWRLITRTPTGFELRVVNLLSPAESTGPVLRFPNHRHEAIPLASSAATARAFLDFSRFPSVEVLQHSNGDVSVHWYDMRFGRDAEPGDPRSAVSPFGAWVRLSAEGAILSHGLGPG